MVQILMKNGRNKVWALIVTIGIMAGLSGCGSSDENVAAGMQAISELDYQSALACFEEAKKQGENERLIVRGEGIAYMGMTQYAKASACFEEALKQSKGLLESMDYDLNYYLASAYTKEKSVLSCLKNITVFVTGFTEVVKCGQLFGWHLE